MKKMVALVLAGTMMAGMASVASATKNFDTPVWCNSTIIRWQILKAIRS